MALSTTRTLLTQTGINTHQVFNIGGLDSVGIATFSNFKTGSTNVHNVGIEAAGINVLGGDTPIGSGSTIYDDGGARFSGVITATSFHGDISQATGAAAGLGTALSQTQTDPLNKIYYTDKVLSISTTQTIDHPATANLAYTQYGDIKIEDGHDLIIKDGDDFKYDILGISTTKIPSNQFPSGLSGDLTGNLTGNVTGNVTGAVTGNVTGDLIGNVTGNIITNKILPTTGAPSGGGGGIIQVIGPKIFAANNAININHNNGGFIGPTYLGSQFDVTITPKFTSSKILIMGMISSVGNANGNVTIHIITRLYRHIAGGTATDTGHSCGTYVANNTYTPHNILYIDSPNTTSAVTYKMYGYGHGATGGQYAWMRTFGTSTFIAAEISA